MGRNGVGAGLSLPVRIGVVAGCCLVLAHCGKLPSGKIDPRYGVAASPRVVQPGEPVPKGGGTYRVGKPYTVAGRTYMPEENAHYRAEGTASWYGEDFHGRLTANGEVYDMDAVSAAHPTLPIPSYARITHLGNRRSIIVRVNDRGPYHPGRLIDVSVRTAKLLGFHENGVAPVRVEYVGPASLAGSDDRKLEATLRRGTPAPGPSDLRVASSAAVRSPAREDDRDGAAESRMVRGAQARAALDASAARRQTASAKQSSSFESRFAPAATLPAAPPRAEPVPAFASAAQPSAAQASVAPAAATQAAGNGAVLTGRAIC